MINDDDNNIELVVSDKDVDYSNRVLVVADMYCYCLLLFLFLFSLWFVIVVFAVLVAAVAVIMVDDLVRPIFVFTALLPIFHLNFDPDNNSR